MKSASWFVGALQPDPSNVNVRPGASPSAEPTAMQNVGLAHETPVSRVPASRLVTALQLAPSKVSAPSALVTAAQNVGDVHETPISAVPEATVVGVHAAPS